MALRLFYVTNLVKNSNLNNQSHLSIKKGVLNMAQTLAQTKQISQSHHKTPDDTNSHSVIYSTQNLDLWYGENHALQNINLDIYENQITAIIGPSGCGKSTYIKTLNRMVELVPSVKTAGKILYRDQDIFDQKYSKEQLRTNVGMVFQQPNPFQNQYTIILLTVQRFTVLKIKKFLMKSLRNHYVALQFGMN